MYRRARVLLNDNIVKDGPSYRGKNMRTHMQHVFKSPYKEAYKDYWSLPMPWLPREYGPKPKPGDPIPLRDAGSLMVIAKNNHMKPGEEGEDYKVLFNHREARARFRKDQFIIPTSPVCIEDRSEEWAELFQSLDVKEVPEDIAFRIAAIRALMAECNMLVIPPEGGQLAEVEGPPGGTARWYNIIGTFPAQLRTLIGILQIPYENAIKSLIPFRRIQTPASENFRFDTVHYMVTFGKMPDVRFCTSAIGEQQCWVSPTEALQRFNCGVLNMTTPAAYLMSELKREFPKFDMIQEMRNTYSEPQLVQPELVYNQDNMMATVLFDGDLHHGKTKKELEAKEAAGENIENLLRFRRFHYMRDDPWGFRAVYFDRPLEDGDDVQELPRVPDRVVQEEEERSTFALPSTSFSEEVKATDLEGTMAMEIAKKSRDPLPSQLNRRMPAISLLDDESRASMGLDKLPTEIEQMAKDAVYGKGVHVDDAELKVYPTMKAQQIPAPKTPTVPK